MASKSPVKNFRERIEQLQVGLRRRSENDCSGLGSSPEAVAERRARVSDQVAGFRYFVNTYFPQHIVHQDTSPLHE